MKATLGAALLLCALVAAQLGPARADATACKRLVYIQFDNTHYTQDAPGVQSDLQQMPTLLSFIRQNGMLFTNDHTVLISHTAGGIVSTLTGLYPDRNGITVSNSYGYYRPNGLAPGFTSAFKNWTDPVDAVSDPLPNFVTNGGKNTPAPWVPFTRAGCDVGSVGMPGMGDGVAIHCAQTSTACNVPDLLPDEPGGYDGFKATFRAQSRFDAASTLGTMAQLEDSGVPVTFGYISAPHDGFGPGEAGYVAQLKAYDAAFANFFGDLASHGIDQSNTLFVFTVDEGDHFAGGTSSTHTFSHGVCTDLTACPSNQLGEVDVNIKSILTNGPAFDMHDDSAPTIYIGGQPKRDDPGVRLLARNAAALTSYDPYSGKTVPLVTWIADSLEEGALHMVNADPARTPSLTLFASPDFFLTSSGCAACVNPAFPWNHGGIQQQVGRTWLGLVGPGVKKGGIGIDFQTWTDHANVRPTILALLGLKDDYVHDGRVLVETMTPSAIPRALRGTAMKRLGAVYDQINAPFGPFATNTLAASTAALTGSDARYASLERKLGVLVTERNRLAVKIRAALDAAAFHGRTLKASTARLWTAQSFAVLSHALALQLLKR